MAKFVVEVEFPDGTEPDVERIMVGVRVQVEDVLAQARRDGFFRPVEPILKHAFEALLPYVDENVCGCPACRAAAVSDIGRFN
jgi:hypothetical protein